MFKILNIKKIFYKNINYEKLIGSELTLVKVMSKVENIATVTQNIIELIIELLQDNKSDLKLIKTAANLLWTTCICVPRFTVLHFP